MNSTARDDAIAALLMLLVALPFAVATGGIYVDPLDPGFGARDFPIIVIGLMILLAIVLLAQAWRRRAGGPAPASGEFGEIGRYLLPMAAIGFLYVWFVDMFQYAVPTFLAGVGSLAMFGNRGWARLAVAPFAATLVYYVLFFGILGLDESPGTVVAFDSHTFFRPLRDALGLF